MANRLDIIRRALEESLIRHSPEVRGQLALDQIEHIARTDLVATTAANALGLIEFDGKLWRPFGAAFGESGNHAV